MDWIERKWASYRLTTVIISMTIMPLIIYYFFLCEGTFYVFISSDYCLKKPPISELCICMPPKKHTMWQLQSTVAYPFRHKSHFFSPFSLFLSLSSTYISFSKKSDHSPYFCVDFLHFLLIKTLKSPTPYFIEGSNSNPCLVVRGLSSHF